MLCTLCLSRSETDQWNYLTVQLSRTSADDKGDPDLYGLFYGGDSGKVRVRVRVRVLSLVR